MNRKKNLVWDNLPIVFLFRHLPWKSVINILHNDNNANVHHLSDMRTEAKLSKVQWEQNCGKNKGFPDSHFPLFSVTSFPLLSFVKRRRNKQQRWVQTNTFSQLDHNRVNFNSKIKSVHQKQWGIEIMVRWRFISDQLFST